MLATATRYTDVRAPARAVRTSRPAAAPALYLPTLRGAADSVSQWYWREMKEGGWLHEYFRREKCRTPERIRQVARFMAGFVPNHKSSFRRLACLPAKLYHRWKQEDEHFFEDDANLRSLRRDAPDLPIYVDPAPLPRARFHKVYPST